LLLSVGYYFIKEKKQVSYESSIIISSQNQSEFLRFLKINTLFGSKIGPFYNFQPINEVTILSRIKNELKSFNEYQKLFKIQSLDESSFILKFTFQDVKKSRNIIEKTLRAVNSNIKENVFEEIDELFKLTKEIIINDDKKRIIFLSKHSLIAKKIDLKFNNLNPKELKGIYDELYYLIGYQPIDEEIKIIQSKDYDELTKLEKDINSLKKTNIEWVKYNFDTIKTITKNKKDIKLYIILSILCGLSLSLIYVFISKGVRS